MVSTMLNHTTPIVHGTTALCGCDNCGADVRIPLAELTDYRLCADCQHDSRSYGPRACAVCGDDLDDASTSDTHRDCRYPCNHVRTSAVPDCPTCERLSNLPLSDR
jgi:hypothetical protein